MYTNSWLKTKYFIEKIARLRQAAIAIDNYKLNLH